MEDGPIHVKMGIRQDGTYEKTIRVEEEDVYIYPLYFSIDHLFDIGEYLKVAKINRVNLVHLTN